MKNKLLPFVITVVICLATSIRSFAQDGYFEQGYGGETDEGGKAVYVKLDHSVIMVGFKQVTSTNRDILIIKTDSLGDTLWTKTLGGAQDDEALSLIRDRNGNYVLAGYTASSGMGGKDIYVASFTDAGVINWEQTYGTNYDEKAESIIQFPGSGSPNFALVGTKVLSSSDEDAVVLKINATGTQQWTTSIGGTGIQQGKAIAILNVVDTIPGSGDSLVICGTEFPTGSSNTIGFVASLGFNGNAGGYFSYPTLGNTEFYSLAFYSGSLYVAGQLTSTGNDVNGLLLKTNTKGEVIYSYDYGGDETDVFYHIINFSGSMVATGFTESTGEGDKDMWQCFIEEDGTLHKELRYGGEGTDIGYHSFLRGSELYTVGYNNSFGITTSGNLYLTRANLAKWVCNYPSYPDGSLPNYWLETVQLDCSMKRILMVRDMFTGIRSNFYICKWCTSYPNNPDHLNTNSIPVTDITNSGSNYNANHYTGIIGNDDNETKLLDFCQKHGINQLLFYSAGYLFVRTGPDLPNEYVTVTGINITGLPTSMTIQKYMTYRLNQFITRAKRDYGVELVGVIAGGNNYTFNNWKFYENVTNFNQVKADFSQYNYSNTGKINTVMMEDEFWNDVDKDANGNLIRYVRSDVNAATREANFRTYLFDPHLAGLKRMLDLPYYDRNMVDVFGYYGYMHRMMWDQVSPGVWNHINDEDWSSSTDQPAIIDRVEEIENAAGVKEGFKLSNIFSLYYTTTTSTQIYGDGSIPFHRPDYAFRTATFGQTRPINIYPLFSVEAYQRSVDLSEPWQYWSGEDVPDNFLGIWLTARDNNNSGEMRTLIDVENKWMDGYPSNAYYNVSGVDPGNKKFNGFGYFMYEFLQRISQYNITETANTSTFANNFSNNTTNSAVHVPKDETVNATNFALIGNLCGKCVYHWFGETAFQFHLPQTDKVGASEARVFIYPNPNLSESAVIVFSQPLPDEALIHVSFTDMVGKTVWQGTLTALQLRQVDISMLPAGWYVVNITGSDGIMLKSKFIKQ